MTQTDTMTQRKRWQRWSPISWILRLVTTERGRRIMFVASLYGRMSKLHRLHDDAIQRLNRIMHLARDPHALRLPTLLGALVWRNTRVDALLSQCDPTQPPTQQELEDISASIVRSAPYWVTYGRADTLRHMQRDACTLLRTRMTELPTTEA